MADSAPAGYYAFERDDGGYNGLIRVSDVEGGGKHLQTGVTGAWVTDQSLLRYFVNPGTTDLTLIDCATAEPQAARYGVEFPD